MALELKLRRVPDLLATQSLTSPFLFGVVRPRIVLSETLLESLDPAELRAVLTHELVHWQRRDTWFGWLQVVAQSGFWFHPFVWWANREIRHQRECVCDEIGAARGMHHACQYGQSILSVLTQSRARSLAAGSLVGVFEPGAKLQNRMEEIMNFEPKKRSFDWRGRLYWAAIAMVFVPMGFGAVGVDVVPVADAADEASNSGPPQIVKTSPATGDVDVDPKLREISVTFDRDMGRGMSWTGGPPLMPPIDETRKAKWINARTCVLPVKLEKAAFYRVGINAPSFKNFSDKSGMPAPVSAIYFTTAGADGGIESPRARTEARQAHAGQRRPGRRPGDDGACRDVRHADERRHVLDWQRTEFSEALGRWQDGALVGRRLNVHAAGVARTEPRLSTGAEQPELQELSKSMGRAAGSGRVQVSHPRQVRYRDCRRHIALHGFGGGGHNFCMMLRVIEPTRIGGMAFAPAAETSSISPVPELRNLSYMIPSVSCSSIPQAWIISWTTTISLCSLVVFSTFPGRKTAAK